MFDQSAENNVHAREELDVVDNLSTTPSTSVDNRAVANAKRESNLEHNGSTISYAETRRPLESETFR
jgi:hypothetical protein